MRWLITKTKSMDIIPVRADFAPKRMYTIPRHWWVDARVFDYIQSLAPWQKVNANTYRFFIYVLFYSYFRRKHGWQKKELQIHSEWIKKRFGQKEKKPFYDWLLVNELLNFSDYKVGEYATKFWVTPSILDAIEAFGVMGRHTHCLFTRKISMSNKPRSPMTKSQIHDEQRNEIGSQFVRNAISILSKTLNVVNLARLEKFYERLEKPMKLAKEQGLPVDISERWSCCLQSLGAFIHAIKQENRDLGDGMWGYHPAYSMAYTGRIFEIGKGLQGLSVSIRKRALYKVSVRNFDLSASQLRILAWYTNDPDLLPLIPEIYNQMAKWGYPKAKVKTAIFAFLFNAGNERNKGFYELYLYRPSNILLRSFLRLMRPFQLAVKKALCKLISEKLYRSGKDGGFWRNLCEMDVSEKALILSAEKGYQEKITQLYNRSPKAPWHKIIDRKLFIENFIMRKLLAFTIQGIESYVIHRLTTMGSKYGFLPLSNQHDGLIIAETNSGSIQAAMSFINQEMEIDLKLEEKPIG